MPRDANPFQGIPWKIRLMDRDAGARLKVRRWLPPLLWAGVILFVTSIPGSAVPRELAPYDKVIHFSVYGVFAVLLNWDLSQAMGRWRATVLSIIIAMLFGALDEWHQGFIPGRAADPSDWRADSLGAAGGAVLFALYRRIRGSNTTAEI